MTERVWEMRDLDAIALIEQECFSVAPWNRRMLAESFLSEHFYGVLLEEEGAITAYGDAAGGETGAPRSTRFQRACPAFVSQKRLSRIVLQKPLLSRR